ncbi:MAG: C39 family peptidase [Planctomycetota bacterium]
MPAKLLTAFLAAVSTLLTIPPPGASAGHTHVTALGPGGLAPRAGVVTPAEDREVVWSGDAIVLPEFTEALLSWNIDLSDRQAAAMDVRVAAGTEDWSPWMTVTTWQGSPRAAEVSWGEKSFAEGKINTDYFKSTDSQRWDRLQYRVRVAPTAHGTPVLLRRVDVTVTGPADVPASEAGSLKDSIRLDVPFRSQRTERPEIAGRICSPTSVAMVMAYHGADEAVGRVAEVIYDQRHDIYGNWPRAVQGAHAMGIGGYLTRFDDWQDVRDTIERHGPIIASIRVREGELPEAPYDKTAGHLIVLTGFDGEGGVLVNDPAVESENEGRLVYPMRAMETVWMRGSRGTAYVLTGPSR